jgi:hypothetical protein
VTVDDERAVKVMGEMSLQAAHCLHAGLGEQRRPVDARGFLAFLSRFPHR